MLWCDDIVDSFTRQRDVSRVRVHFTVLVEGPLDVSKIKIAHSVSKIDFDDECDVECTTVTNRL